MYKKHYINIVCSCSCLNCYISIKLSVKTIYWLLCVVLNARLLVTITNGQLVAAIHKHHGCCVLWNEDYYY